MEGGVMAREYQVQHVCVGEREDGTELFRESIQSKNEGWSLALSDGYHKGCLWVGCHPFALNMELDESGVRILIAELQRFLDTGTVKPKGA